MEFHLTSRDAQLHRKSYMYAARKIEQPQAPDSKACVYTQKMIQIASNKDDIVFDPFMGVGSTGVAALALERRFIGVEIDENYFNAAKTRINNAQYT